MSVNHFFHLFSSPHLVEIFAVLQKCLCLCTGGHIHPAENPPGRDGPGLHLSDVREVFPRGHDPGE